MINHNRNEAYWPILEIKSFVTNRIVYCRLLRKNLFAACETKCIIAFFSIFHSELDTNIATDDAKLGIYNGKEFVFLESSWKWLNMAKLIWRYGPISLRNMDNALTRMLKDFVKIYDFQENEQAFKY